MAKIKLNSMLDFVKENAKVVSDHGNCIIKVAKSTKTKQLDKKALIESKINAKRLSVAQSTITQTQKFFKEVEDAISKLLSNDEAIKEYQKWFKSKSMALLSVTATMHNIDTVPGILANYLVKAYGFILEVEMHAKSIGLEVDLQVANNLMFALIASLPDSTTDATLSRAAAAINHLVSANTNFETVMREHISKIKVKDKMLSVADYRKIAIKEVEDELKKAEEDAKKVTKEKAKAGDSKKAKPKATKVKKTASSKAKTTTGNGLQQECVK